MKKNQIKKKCQNPKIFAENLQQAMKVNTHEAVRLCWYVMSRPDSQLEKFVSIVDIYFPNPSVLGREFVSLGYSPVNLVKNADWGFENIKIFHARVLKSMIDLFDDKQQRRYNKSLFHIERDRNLISSRCYSRN